MDDNHLSHSTWDCKYHLVWCPKYRFQILKGDVGKSMQEIEGLDLPVLGPAVEHEENRPSASLPEATDDT